MLGQRARGLLLGGYLGPGALRYLLALTVVFFHATRFVPIGHAAVYMFFVLSGYWMSRTYRRVYMGAPKPWRTYAISRTWRIVPLYVVVLGMTLTSYAAYQWLTGQAPNDALQRVQSVVVLARNLVILGLHDYDSRVVVPVWSLDIELRFYALVPVLVACRARWGTPVLAVAALLSVGALCGRIWGDVPGYGVEYLIAFIAGMALDGRSSAPVFGQATLLATNALAAIVMVLPYAWPAYGNAIFWHRELSWRGINVWEAHNVALAALLVPFIDHNVRRPSSSLDRGLGQGAYPLYLVHWGFLCLYAARFGQAPQAVKLLGSAGYVFVTCGSAWLLERFIDRASEVARQRWLTGHVLTAPVARGSGGVLGT